MFTNAKKFVWQSSKLPLFDITGGFIILIRCQCLIRMNWCRRYQHSLHSIFPFRFDFSHSLWICTYIERRVHICQVIFPEFTFVQFAYYHHWIFEFHLDYPILSGVSELQFQKITTNWPLKNCKFRLLLHIFTHRNYTFVPIQNDDFSVKKLSKTNTLNTFNGDSTNGGHWIFKLYKSFWMICAALLKGNTNKHIRMYTMVRIQSHNVIACVDKTHSTYIQCLFCYLFSTLYN